MSADETANDRSLLGVEAWKRILAAPNEDAVAELMLEATKGVSRADFACLARLTSRGTIEITRHNKDDEASRKAGRASTPDLSECRAAAEDALARHKARYAPPLDVGSNDESIPETNEGIPLSVVAKVLPHGEKVLGILIVVRESEKTFTPDERRAFTITVHSLTYGLLQREARRPTTAPARDARPLASPGPKDEKHEAEVVKAKSRLVKRSDVDSQQAALAAIVGSGASHAKLLDTLLRFAPSALPVMIRGESGTGKELVAHAIHQVSPRRSGPFITVNAAAIPSDLVEAELFGYAKGSFTGANKDSPGLVGAAHGGTLFIDEFGDLPLALQAKVLRVIQEKKVRRVGETDERAADFRLVVATHQPLEALVAEGKFREDLYYRVASLAVFVPALRERREDIPLLIEHFVRLHGEGRRPSFTPEAREWFQTHPWRGNIRELRNAIERGLAHGNEPIPLADLIMAQAAKPPPTLLEPDDARRARYQQVFDEVGTIKGAAARLGVDRNTVGRVLKRWRFA